MPLYEVITKSVFECAYLIEADSEDEAVTLAFDTDYEAGAFMQKHEGEHTEIVSELAPIDSWDWMNNKVEDGYL